MKRFLLRALLIGGMLIGLGAAGGCGAYYVEGYGYNYGYNYGYDRYYYDGTMPPGQRYGGFYGYPY